jgi:hypothetical protein
MASDALGREYPLVARRFLVSFVCLIFPLPLLSQTSPARVLALHTNAQVLQSGVAGIVRIDLTVKPGFKIAKRPAPKLELEPNPSFQVDKSGFSESGSGKDPDYFGGFKSLELKIIPAKTIKVGKHFLEGKLTYFYCSEQEKYCSRSMEPFAVAVEVVEKKPR